MDRVLKGTGAPISVTFYVDETATDSTVAVTVQIIRDSDGSDVVPAGTATIAGAVADGKYTFNLTPAHTAELDLLTAKWTATINGVAQGALETYVEVVGAFYVTLAEIRALKNLSETSKFTTPELQAARAWFEDTFERFTGVAFVPRYAKHSVDGSGIDSLVLHDYNVTRIRSVVDADRNDTWTQARLDAIRPDDSGVVNLAPDGSVFAVGTRNLTIAYEHGHKAPSEDVRQAALVAIRDKLIGDQTGNRVYSIETERGVERISTPGRDSPFGLPFVDAVAVAYRHKVPVTSIQVITR